MKYPKFIKQGSTIGICAPSSGVGKFVQKFQRSIDNLHAYGYQTKETRLFEVKVNQAILQPFVQRKSKSYYLIKMSI